MARNQMIAAFADELSAHEYFATVVWPDGRRVCLRCGVPGRVGKLDGTTTRIGAYKCYACRRMFRITHGTIFERSHVPLHKWLQAIYLTDAGSKTMLPFHLARTIKVSMKTATNMIKMLKAASAMDGIQGLERKQGVSMVAPK
ncbi:MAG: transposase [Proteobacteria bacterium]|nr:transposase [Pseudomonadota bacterium]